MTRWREWNPDFNPRRNYGTGATGYDPLYGQPGSRDERGLGGYGENPYGYYGQYRYGGGTAGMPDDIRQIEVRQMDMDDLIRQGEQRQRAWKVSEPQKRSRRGPKDYRRSDERILDDIYQRLLQDDSVEVSDVTVDVRDGHATLTGTVPERTMRYAVEDLAASCAGVEDVTNELRVAR